MHPVSNNIVYIENNMKALKVPYYGFVQEKIYRQLGRGDFYYIWRRIHDGIETWLCVIWHKNWNNRRGSTEMGSYLREDVERWAINSLMRIHHPWDVREAVHSDFEFLETNSSFIPE